MHAFCIQHLHGAEKSATRLRTIAEPTLAPQIAGFIVKDATMQCGIGARIASHPVAAINTTSIDRLRRE